MPQGRPELHEKFGDDSKAWAVLKAAGWTHDKGVMSPPTDDWNWQLATQDERDAAEYLVTEWDWAY